MNDSVSVIMPAFNEQGNILDAIRSAMYAVNQETTDYEIIVIDDGSTDRTKELIDEAARLDPHIRTCSNGVNKGYGFSFRRGVNMATKAFVTQFPGDNDLASDSLRDLIRERGKADMVTTYSGSPHMRSLFRRTISKSFVFILNSLFGLNLKYYNGAFICRTELLKSIPIKSDSLAVLAECVIRVIKLGHSYKSIPFIHIGRKHEKSKAFSFKSVRTVGKMVIVLTKDIYFGREYKNKKICCIS